MLFLVATNVVASRPPEHRPTGTPHARAKNVHPKITKLKTRKEFTDAKKWQGRSLTITMKNRYEYHE